jgi:hypothetical protein
MGLSASTRSGPYEILVPLGADGMSEVHGARERQAACAQRTPLRSVALAAEPQVIGVMLHVLEAHLAQEKALPGKLKQKG